MTIRRFPGSVVGRSRAVEWNGLVFTVADAKDTSKGMKGQTEETLAIMDKNLADAGSDKSRILQALVYITDMSQKPAMDEAWSAWVDTDNPPMRACVETGLDTGTLVEMVFVAAK